MTLPQELATISNYALYSAMAVLALAMLAYAGYLAGLMPARSETRDAEKAERAEKAREEALVGAGAPRSRDEIPADEIPADEIPAGEIPADAVVDVAPAPAPKVPIDEGVSTTARKLAGIAGSLSWLATLLLLASVLFRGLSVSRAPLGNMFEFSVVAAMFVMLAFCLWSTRRDLRWLGLFVVTPVLLVLGIALVYWYTEAAELLPSLQSYWLVIHVTVAVLAMAVFFIGAVMGILYLAQDKVEQSGRVSILNRFPSAKSLERLTYGLHVIGFPLWTFTLIAGAIWARQAWASYWNWDPKEVWTFVIWVVYAAYLHARVTSGWSKQKATYIALAGFVCILINYGVVNLFFVSQHSYSGL